MAITLRMDISPKMVPYPFLPPPMREGQNSMSHLTPPPASQYITTGDIIRLMEAVLDACLESGGLENEGEV